MAELLYKVKRLEHIKLAIVALALNIIDAVLTQKWINMGGIDYELNPMLRHLLRQFGWSGWIIKMAGVVGVILLLLWVATKYPHLVKIIFIGVIIFMCVICLHNGIGLIQLLS